MAYPKLLGSSDNPEKLSRTISGLIPLLILINAWFNLGIDQAEITGAMDVTAVAGMAVLGAYSAVKTAYGTWRKIYNAVRER